MIGVRSEPSKAPVLNHRQARGLFSRRVGSLSPSSPEDLQSSFTDENSLEEKKKKPLFYTKKHKGHALVTLEKLFTVTATTTSYLTCYSTTNTFFIQGCTPSPFPFVTCPWGKRRTCSHTSDDLENFFLKQSLIRNRPPIYCQCRPSFINVRDCPFIENGRGVCWVCVRVWIGYFTVMLPKYCIYINYYCKSFVFVYWRCVPHKRSHSGKSCLHHCNIL